MPRPPILPQLDWQNIFELGMEWENWLARGEEPDHQKSMRELYDMYPLSETVRGFLKGLPKAVHVAVFGEDWCPDVIRHAPVIQKMADQTEMVSVRYLFREDAPDAFVRFLTNGGEAIPKFIFLSDQWVETGNWGPMPYEAKKIIARGKACGDMKRAREITTEMYTQDPECQVVVQELMEQLDIAASTSPSPESSLLPGEAAAAR